MPLKTTNHERDCAAGWRLAMTRLLRSAALTGLLLLAGCSTYHPWQNAPTQAGDIGLRASGPVERPVFVSVSLSGGGARAAAFALGVLRELKAAEFVVAGQRTTLLDQVALISGVSGGSILAAHYAAFGDESLTAFESEFLLKDFEGSLIQLALSPRRLYRLSSPWYGRSHVLAEQLDALYRGRTFGDLRHRPRGPDLVVTATDLTTGAPFEFTPGQFGLICAELATVPLSFAVAASSAVPLILSPMSLRNFAGSCAPADNATPASVEDNFRTRLLRASAETYADAGKRPYIHLVDGGLTDNLGIRMLLDRVVARGALADSFGDAAPGSIRKVVIVAVNAERELGERIDQSDRVPQTHQVVETLLFGAGGQITQFTMALLSDDKERWRRELAEQRGTQGSPFAADAELHVIAVSLHDVQDSGLRRAVITIPTAFTIDPAQVQHLIAAGREALRRSPGFQHLVGSLARETGGDREPAAAEAARRASLNHEQVP
jgi:NTE family protein